MLFCGDVLAFLGGLGESSVDALITDPPYSSGGLYRGDRAMSVADKYQTDGTVKTYHAFSGDQKDQRSWTRWCAEWLSASRRVLRAGGYAVVFCDWRQLPALTDAMQWSGLMWRGILSWDKGRGARAPHKGYFKHQCEYLVWGTNGPCPVATHGGPWDGCYSVSVKPAEKKHMAAKPIGLMRELVKIVPAGGLVMDPFMGSGTTGVACALEGREFCGCELDEVTWDLACREIANAAARE